jgi:cell shape-determining protein MreD
MTTSLSSVVGMMRKSVIGFISTLTAMAIFRGMSIIGDIGLAVDFLVVKLLAHSLTPFLFLKLLRLRMRFSLSR